MFSQADNISKGLRTPSALLITGQRNRIHPLSITDQPSPGNAKILAAASPACSIGRSISISATCGIDPRSLAKTSPRFSTPYPQQLEDRRPGPAADFGAIDPERLQEDLRTATFIFRPGTKGFRFAHTSLQEYFLATYLQRMLREGLYADLALPFAQHQDPELSRSPPLPGDHEDYPRRLKATHAGCGPAAAGAC